MYTEQEILKVVCINLRYKPCKAQIKQVKMGGGSSKDCWCENHPGVRQVCPVQISQRYLYLTLADLSKTEDTETNNAQYGLINSMIFATGTFHTGSLGLGLILGILLTLFVFWIRRKCRRRTKQRVEKRTWHERFLQALAWGRPAAPQPPQPAATAALLPATHQIVTSPTHHQMVHTPSLHNPSHPSAPATGMPALPAPAAGLPALPAPPLTTNYPTVLYSPNSFL